MNKKQNKVENNRSKSYDSDTAVFIAMCQELKEEGNRLFLKRDLEGAMMIYEKALNLLPKNHIDVRRLRTNIAACYMQMGLSEYPKAIHECNLALEVTPKYSKAVVKRSRCYESLNKLDLAFRDVNAVLNMEHSNTMALEISERVRSSLEKQVTKVVKDKMKKKISEIEECVEPPSALQTSKVVKEKTKKNNNKKISEALDNKVVDQIEVKVDENVEDKKAEDKYVERPSASRTSKVVKEKKISEAQDDKVVDRIEVKKVDENVEEKKAEDKCVEPPSASQTSKVVKEKTKKISEAQDDKVVDRIEEKKVDENVEEKKAEDKKVVEEKISSKMEVPKKSVKLILGEDIRWAQLPLNCSLVQLREVIHDQFPSSRAVLVKYRDEEGDLVTITSDEELRLAELAAESRGSVRLYVVQVDSKQDPFFERFNRNGVHNVEIKRGAPAQAQIRHWTQLQVKVQDLFDMAADKSQEMTALALCNWGNVHLSRATKRVYVTEDGSRESILEQIKTTYDYAHLEYSKAGKRYEEALRLKPDFYEAHLALGQQQFEQAKLYWHYAIANNVDPETWPSEKVLHLYNNAEENMERGMQMCEELERQRLRELSDSKKEQNQLKKTGSDGLFQDISTDEAAEQAINLSAQINLLWRTILYERSIMEFKLGLPVWHECLELAIEKFERAGVSPIDITVMVKNHYSNNIAPEGKLTCLAPHYSLLFSKPTCETITR
ncbi:OS-9 [Hibiscus syriacus]|uniref:OS-9 n=1 Tax=Hibiscus syriacus TaxID=106335 RepID=A0A6A2Z7J9_HIBSY|nr:OS-9 [Hibiscus syriacus]